MEVLVFEIIKTMLPYEIIIIILGLLSAIFYNKIIGKAGEYWCSKELKKLSRDKYIVLNNILLKDDSGTHQIDHVVISKYGIFVIEVKNYGGFIVGSENYRNWVQYLGKKKFCFYNPLYQNYGHIKALQNVTKLDFSKFISIICFSNRTKFKVKTKQLITQTDFIRDKILNYKTEILRDDLNCIAKSILSNNILDKKERKNHVQYVKIKK